MGKSYMISVVQCCYTFLAIYALVCSLASAKSEAYGSICPSLSIRNSVENLKILENCTIIEGYLEILLMDKSTVQTFANVSFPKLIEIRDYLVLYRIRGLQSIGKLFPKLSIIRGSRLFSNYGLVVYEMIELKNIGLSNLTDILRGSVRIEKNPNLCYINTINWDLIARSGKDGHFIKANKNSAECHDVCPHEDDKSLCPANENQYGLNLCWNRYTCQKVCSRDCVIKDRACAQPGRCCHSQCLGGCTGSKDTDCVVCRNVIYSGKCLESCPSSMFQFNGRCLTKKECEDLPSRKSHTDVHYKTWKVEGKARSGQCSLSCPHGYMPQGKHGCLKCAKACSKVCPGMKISNLATAQKLDGCTAINGSLKIQLTGQGSSIYQELEKFLGLIETIDGYLKIIHSAPLISLNFLRNLTLIKGNELDQGLYSIVVRSNDNLQQLWDWPSRQNELVRNGRPLFHYNQKLCTKTIIDAMNAFGIKNISLKEISKTSNGNKGACAKENIELDVENIFSTSVFLLFDNFRKFHHDPRTILSFVISHREVKANENKVSLYDGRDACGDGDWKVEDYEGASDKNDKIRWVIHDLVPDTRYAAHVMTSVIDSEKKSGFSKILYFKTQPDHPTSPIDLTFSHISQNALELKWIPPLKPNGKVTHYIISWVQELENIDEVRQKNFCEDLSISFKSKLTDKTEVKPPSFNNITTPSNNSCSCIKGKKLLEADIKEQILFENYIQNAAFKKKIKKKPRSKRSLDNDPSTLQPEVSTATIFVSSTPFVQNVEEAISLRPLYYIKNLRHFTKYHIKVKACQEFDHSINDTLCSNTADIYRRTKPKREADYIDIKTVHSKIDNHTSGLVYISWKEPPQPNGVIDGYQVEYKRVDIQNFKPITVCITQKKFKEKKGHSLHGLQSGKYSMRLQAISLAGKGAWTDYTYFNIQEHKSGLDTSTLLIIISFSICAVVAFIAFVIWWGFKRRYKARLESSNLLTSVNPEYSEYVPDEWEMPRKNIEMGRPLGQGTFGMVYEGIAVDLKTGRKFKCAMKTVNQKSSAKEFLKEASVMKGFTCHHVVKLKGVVSIGTPTLVIMELMENGDLRNFLRSQRQDYVPEENQHPGRLPPKPNQFVQMAAEIADGMDYLSTNKFVHRDLAARNCMVARDMTVKIGDFGMTRDIYETDYYRKGGKGMLPVRWMAPESLKDGVYTSRSDVWSYGVVLWEMVTLACQPYPGLSNEEVFNYIISGGIMEKPLNCDDKLYNIMMSCWQVNPSLRPTFNELVTCFLSGINTNFKKRAFHFHAQISNGSDSDDPDDAELLDPSSPLRNSSQNKKETSKPKFINRLLFRYHKSKKMKSSSFSKNNTSELPSDSENHKPTLENHKMSDATNSAISNKCSNHSSNGFIPSENTASTCC